MPEIQIRPAINTDIELLVALDHDYTSDYAWQMDIRQEESGEINVQFRQIRLPRSARVEYPRQFQLLRQDWESRAGLLVASVKEDLVGYISLAQALTPATAWVNDLAVKRAFRRQGIGSALVLASQTWARQHDCQRVVLEMQSKNYPAICLAQKLGFDFCGYNDRYYLNRDIALFFAKSVR